MYFNVAIEVLQLIRRWNQLIAENPDYYAAVIIGTILAPATEVLFIWLVARRRRGWPRWLLSLPVLVEILYDTKYGYVYLRSLSFVDFAIVYAFDAVQVIALYLIFTGNAREWFKNDPKFSRSSALVRAGPP